MSRARILLELLCESIDGGHDDIVEWCCGPVDLEKADIEYIHEIVPWS